MRCPNCDQSLHAAQYEGAAIHTCNGCHGEFLSSEALRQIVNTRDETFPDQLLEDLADARPTFGAPPADCGRALACPACDLPMSILNYATDSGVIIDRCASCGGVWLDADELECVQAILERWQDQAPDQIKAAQPALRAARSKARRASASTAGFSRFDFISALVNRMLNRAA